MLELSTYTPASLVAPLEPPLTFRRHSGRGKARDEATGRGRHGGRETTFFVQLPYFLSIFVCAGRVSLCPKRAQEASGRAVTATVTPGLGRPIRASVGPWTSHVSLLAGPASQKIRKRRPPSPLCTFQPASPPQKVHHGFEYLALGLSSCLGRLSFWTISSGMWLLHVHPRSLMYFLRRVSSESCGSCR